MLCPDIKIRRKIADIGGKVQINLQNSFIFCNFAADIVIFTMKKIFLLVLFAFLVSVVNAQILSAESPSVFNELFKSYQFYTEDHLNIEQFVEDTITLHYMGAYDDKTNLLTYAVPDTIWIKRRKNAVEGKHYYLLHHYAAVYTQVNKKTFSISDATPCGKIFHSSNTIMFSLKELLGDTALLLEDLKSHQAIYLDLRLLSNQFYLKSKKLSRYYNQLIGKTYYNCEKPQDVSKKYKQSTIDKATVYLTNQFDVKLNANINRRNLRTREQFLADSITEVRYWEDYYRPRCLDYVINNPEIQFDSTFKSITNFDKGTIAFLVKTKRGTYIGQNIIDGKLEQLEWIKADEGIWVLGIDTVRGSVYYICGDDGKIFYISANDVKIQWSRTSLLDGEETHEDVSRQIKALASSSKDIQQRFFEYMKAFVYRIYTRDLDKIIEQQNVMKQTGVYIEKMRLYKGDYSAVGLELNVMNLSNKIIKYIDFTTTALDPVDEPVSTKTVHGFGPIRPFETGEYDFENIWWNDYISSHNPKSMVITYMDGSKKKLTKAQMEKCINSWIYETDYEKIISFPKLKALVKDMESGELLPYKKPLF